MSIPLFFAVYCIEAGIFFVVAPWTPIWIRNPLFEGSLAMLATNPFLRGFISGIGVIHILIGVKDMMRISRARRATGE